MEQSKAVNALLKNSKKNCQRTVKELEKQFKNSERAVSEQLNTSQRTVKELKKNS